MCVLCVACVLHINAFICKCCVCVCVCVWGWIDERVQIWIHSYVCRQSMRACIRRRDPYHGVMRSAAVGYPQTVVIMAAVKGPDAEGRMDAHILTFSRTQASVPLTAGSGQNEDLSIWQRDGNRMLLTGYD